VGIVEKGKVYMGTDSCSCCNNLREDRKDAKMFRNGEFLIAGTGSYRVIQLLRYTFVPPVIHDEADLYAYMCTDFITAVRKCLTDNGCNDINNTNHESTPYSTTLLVGVRGRLFYIGNDYQVGESSDNCFCDGSGYAYAYGALNALKLIKDKRHAVDKILLALDTAAKYSPYVKEPFHTDSI
jgi:ATP-dependent protease HslVU (ClpYQ) peptidase subunit